VKTAAENPAGRHAARPSPVEKFMSTLLELMGRYSKSTLVNVALGELLQKARDGKLPGLGPQRQPSTSKITEHRTRQAKVYCAVVVDTSSRGVVWDGRSTPLRP